MRGQGVVWLGLIGLCGCQKEPPCVEDTGFVSEAAMWASGWQADSAGNQRAFDEEVWSSTCGNEAGTLVVECRDDGFLVEAHVAQLVDPDDPENNLREIYFETRILLNQTDGAQTIERTANGTDGVYVQVGAHAVGDYSLTQNTLVVEEAEFGSHLRGHFEVSWVDNGELYDPGYSFYVGAGEVSGRFDLKCPGNEDPDSDEDGSG